MTHRREDIGVIEMLRNIQSRLSSLETGQGVKQNDIRIGDWVVNADEQGCVHCHNIKTDQTMVNCGCDCAGGCVPCYTYPTSRVIGGIQYRDKSANVVWDGVRFVYLDDPVLSDHQLLATSTDGIIWTYGTSELTKTTALASNGSRVVVVTETGSRMIKTTDDGGNSWTTQLILPSTFNFPQYNLDHELQLVSNGSGFVLVGNGSGFGGPGPDVYYSADGATWTGVRIAGALNVYLFAVTHIGSTYYASGGATIAGVYQNRLYKSTDGGATWTSLTPPISGAAISTDPNVYSGIGNTLIVVTRQGSTSAVNRVWFSSDEGSSWTEGEMPQSTRDCYFLINNGTTYFMTVYSALTSLFSIYMGTDLKNWTRVSAPCGTNLEPSYILATNSTQVVATFPHYSANQGATFTMDVCGLPPLATPRKGYLIFRIDNEPVAGSTIPNRGSWPFDTFGLADMTVVDIGTNQLDATSGVNASAVAGGSVNWRTILFRLGDLNVPLNAAMAGAADTSLVQGGAEVLFEGFTYDAGRTTSAFKDSYLYGKVVDTTSILDCADNRVIMVSMDIYGGSQSFRVVDIIGGVVTTDTFYVPVAFNPGGSAYSQARIFKTYGDISGVNQNFSWAQSVTGLAIWAERCETDAQFLALYNQFLTATVEVPPTPPSNDNWADATTIAVTSGSYTVGTVYGSTIEAGEFTLSGSNQSVWYKFISSTSRSITFDTILSGVDTTLQLFSGASIPGATLLASDDDGGLTGNSSLLTYAVAAGVEYHLQVAPYSSGSYFDFTLRWN